MTIKTSSIIIAALVAVNLFTAGWLIYDKSGTNDGSFLQTRQKGGKFTSPLLECDVISPQARKGLIPFESQITTFVQREIASGKISDAALYYRDLQNGPWFGFQEDKAFIPASLLKVSLMMTYYKEAQENPGLLKKEFFFSEKFTGPKNTVQEISPENELRVGRSYAVEDLIERAIVDSDNQAASLLLAHIDRQSFGDLFSRLGVPDLFSGGVVALSVKDYATFFRILYNASFLNFEMSEKALEVLSRVKFKEGIAAGVPRGVLTSHKFGEAGTMEERQLHDCGIIYHPLRPYLLCAMTRGKDLNKMKVALAEISGEVFRLVDEQFK